MCLIGAGVGLLTGTGFGIAKGIYAIGKFRREEMPRGWAAFMSGGGLACVAFIAGAATVESAGLALLGALLIGGAWGALCGYGKVTVITGIGLVIGYIVILGMLATAVGFGIGLAIDKAMGNF